MMQVLVENCPTGYMVNVSYRLKIIWLHTLKEEQISKKKLWIMTIIYQWKFD